MKLEVNYLLVQAYGINHDNRLPESWPADGAVEMKGSSVRYAAEKVKHFFVRWFVDVCWYQTREQIF